MPNFIQATIAREGGYVDHPADRGGPTNLGITLPVLTDWLGRGATVAELKALTPADAEKIYQARFLDGPGISKIPDETLRAVVFDAAVNHGPVRAIKMLQEAIGATPDGILGPETVRKATDLGTRLAPRFLARRMRFFANLARKDEAQRVFLAGWILRGLDQLEPLL